MKMKCPGGTGLSNRRSFPLQWREGVTRAYGAVIPLFAQPWLPSPGQKSGRAGAPGSLENIVFIRQAVARL
jgi:hypothetical protein